MKHKNDKHEEPLKNENPEAPETERDIPIKNAEESDPPVSDEDTAFDETEVLRARIEELEGQIAELKDRLLRDHAEMDNTRKRLVKEKQDAIAFANTQLIEQLLVPMDNLQRAVESCSGAASVQAIADGVGMVGQQFADVMKRNGLEAVDSTPGTPFNPQEHEACMMQNSADVQEETVAGEFVRGYKLHGRVIRPAKVKVLMPEV